MRNAFIDTETCGLHGMPVLLQYAIGNGDIELYEIWREPVCKTLMLLEWLTDFRWVGFNWTFDSFHLSKLNAIFSLMADHYALPSIEEAAHIESNGGMDGPILKPQSAIDLMLVAQRSKYQSLMRRKPIRIRRVPTVIASALCSKLNAEMDFAEIYTGGKDLWTVLDIEKGGKKVLDFKDLKLEFHASMGLKPLCRYILGSEVTTFEDIESPPAPVEYGFAPYAAATGATRENGWLGSVKVKGKLREGLAWPGLIQQHIDFWATNDKGRRYASDDITLTRALYYNFEEHLPELDPCGDDDSVLACMVGPVRWRGFTLDLDKVAQLREEAVVASVCPGCEITKPASVRAYIAATMDQTEEEAFLDTTRKERLIEISKWEITKEEPCTKCDIADGGSAAWCDRCGGDGVLRVGRHPAAVRSQAAVDAKIAASKVGLFDKLLIAKRFHASLKVIGAKSARMSGADGLNAQGIKAEDTVRSAFTMTHPGQTLCGGDMIQFEAFINDAVYGDPDFRRILLGKEKIHGLFGSVLYDMPYKDVVATAGTSRDLYTNAKSGVFAILFEGDAGTLCRNLQGVTRLMAERAMDWWLKKFPNLASGKESVKKELRSLHQPGGEGSKVFWRNSLDSIESFMGDRRYFTLENQVMQFLYSLAGRVPRSWEGAKMPVVRNHQRGVQSALGAAASAIYGAAFGIQGAKERAGLNHRIQSPGARMTKIVQRRIWDFQPPGAGPLRVMPLNIHDEVLCPMDPELVQPVAQAVKETIESFREKVPLIGMNWNLEMASWAEKKGGSATLDIISPIYAEAMEALSAEA